MVNVNKLNETIDELDEQSRKVKAVILKYEELAKQVQRGHDEQSQIINKIQEIDSSLVETCDAYKENISVIQRKHSELLKTYNEAQVSAKDFREELFQSLQETRDDLLDTSEDAFKKVQDELKKFDATIKSNLESVKNSMKEQELQQLEFKEQMVKSILEFKGEMSKLYLDQSRSVESQFILHNGELKTEIRKYTDEISDFRKESNNAIKVLEELWKKDSQENAKRSRINLFLLIIGNALLLINLILFLV
jgi:hypothetical protein